jgi:DNA primase
MVLKHFDVRHRSGVEWQCLCIFHEDSSPSLSVNVVSGLYICYACGAKGNGKKLSEHLGVLPRHDANATIDSVLGRLQEYEESRKPKQYCRVDASHWEQHYRIIPNWADEWQKRLGDTFSDDLAGKFALGYDSFRHELVIPIFDWDGSAESAVRRKLGKFDGPKYLYSKGFKTSHHLYGAWQVRAAHPTKRPKRVAIVEGSIDALSLWGIGIPAVALLGSQLSPVQKRLLYRLDAVEYVVMTDRDAAGAKAGMQIEQAMRHTGSLVLHPTTWPAGAKDAAEMSSADRMSVFNFARHTAIDT